LADTLYTLGTHAIREGAELGVDVSVASVAEVSLPSQEHAGLRLHAPTPPLRSLWRRQAVALVRRRLSGGQPPAEPARPPRRRPPRPASTLQPDKH